MNEPSPTVTAPTLVVMAAGVGSRFGGTKQLAAVGPAGEAIIDYTISDARAAGFGTIVLIVRTEIEDMMREHLSTFHADADAMVFVRQDEHVPLPEGRTKPFGTGHAILCAAEHVPGPFAVVNADDYYGSEAFVTLADALSTAPCHHLVAYELQQTLSEAGTVSRGVCGVTAEGYLDAVHEHLAIERGADGRIMATPPTSSDSAIELAPDTPVSMNLWGLQPGFFDRLRTGFDEFLVARSDDPRSEYLLPEVIGGMLRDGTGRVQVHRTTAEWLGITYPDDLADAAKRIGELVRSGAYPSPINSGTRPSSEDAQEHL